MAKTTPENPNKYIAKYGWHMHEDNITQPLYGPCAAVLQVCYRSSFVFISHTVHVARCTAVVVHLDCVVRRTVNVTMKHTATRQVLQRLVTMTMKFKAMRSD